MNTIKNIKNTKNKPIVQDNLLSILNLPSENYRLLYYTKISY